MTKRRETSIDSTLKCLEDAAGLAREAKDASTLVKIAEVYLDVAKLLGESNPTRPASSPRVAAGLEAEGRTR